MSAIISLTKHLLKRMTFIWVRDVEIRIIVHHIQIVMLCDNSITVHDKIISSKAKIRKNNKRRNIFFYIYLNILELVISYLSK